MLSRKTKASRLSSRGRRPAITLESSPHLKIAPLQSCLLPGLHTPYTFFSTSAASFMSAYGLRSFWLPIHRCFFCGEAFPRYFDVMNGRREALVDFCIIRVRVSDHIVQYKINWETVSSTLSRPAALANASAWVPSMTVEFCSY